jgi:hypothetical protein
MFDDDNDNDDEAITRDSLKKDKPADRPLERSTTSSNSPAAVERGKVGDRIGLLG